METIQRASTSSYDVSLKCEDYLNLYPKAPTIQCNNTTTTHHTMPPSDSTTESPAAGPLHYRWIAQDHGGTYKHTTTDPPPPGPKDALDLLNLPAIGTWQCRTCVGVYMQISPTSCFIAHINAAHVRPNWHDSKHSTDRSTNRIVTELEGAYVKKQVIQRLKKESRRSGWPPVNEIDRVWLVCPMLRFQGKTLSGAYIVQGIREFLQRDTLPVDKWSEGFVVKISEDDKISQFPLHPREEWRPPLPDDGVDYVAHMLPGDKRAKERWFIPITDMWRKRRFLGRLENALVEGQDGWAPIRRRHRRSMGMLVNVRVEGQDEKLPMRRTRSLSE
jgi:hypothetical protein